MKSEATLLMALVGALVTFLVATGIHIDDKLLEAGKNVVMAAIPVVLAFYARSKVTSQKTLEGKYTSNDVVLEALSNGQGATRELATKLAAKQAA